MPERGSNLLHVMDSTSGIDVRGQESCMGHTNRKKWIDNYFKAVLSATNYRSTVENVKRSHLQVCIWKSALDQDPSNLDCTQYVWEKFLCTKSMLPTTVPANVQFANYILKLIPCTCTSEMQCTSLRCGYNNPKIACLLFCRTLVKFCNKRSKSITYVDIKE